MNGQRVAVVVVVVVVVVSSSSSSCQLIATSQHGSVVRRPSSAVCRRLSSSSFVVVRRLSWSFVVVVCRQRHRRWACHCPRCRCFGFGGGHCPRQCTSSWRHERSPQRLSRRPYEQASHCCLTIVVGNSQCVSKAIATVVTKKWHGSSWMAVDVESRRC